MRWRRSRIFFAAVAAGLVLLAVARWSPRSSRPLELQYQSTRSEHAVAHPRAVPDAPREDPRRLPLVGPASAERREEAQQEGALHITLVHELGPGLQVPVPGALLRLTAETTERRAAGIGDAVTDSAGRVEWTGLAAGGYRIESPTLGYRFATVEASKRTSDVWSVPRIVTLVGTVVANDGVPVAGARVWLSQLNTSVYGEEVTTTDSGGYFTTRIVLDAIRWLTVMADGYQVADFAELRPDDALLGGELEVHLRLEPGGDTLRAHDD